LRPLDPLYLFTVFLVSLLFNSSGERVAEADEDEVRLVDRARMKNEAVYRCCMTEIVDSTLSLEELVNLLLWIDQLRAIELAL
jgi:hypothetical protein